MKKYLFLVLMTAGLIPAARAQTKCDANINGFHVKKLYITGDHRNAVAWAYKNLSQDSCFTPVTNINDADAVLELPSNPLPHARTHGDDSSPLSVSCSSTPSSTLCYDSTGYMLSTTCSGGSCSTYYGPNPLDPLFDALFAKLDEKIFNADYQGEAYIYTVDHKLLWRSEDVKNHFPWMENWQDKLHSEGLTPPCKIPGARVSTKKYQNWRHWVAENNCGIDFDPIVSIDLKAQEKAGKSKEAQKEALMAEMRRNAAEAAAKQKDVSEKGTK